MSHHPLVSEALLLYDAFSFCRRKQGEAGMESFRVAAKANPWYKDGKTFDDPVGGLNAASVKEQLRASLSSLRCSIRPSFHVACVCCIKTVAAVGRWWWCSSRNRSPVYPVVQGRMRKRKKVVHGQMCNSLGLKIPPALLFLEPPVSSKAQIRKLSVPNALR